MTVFATGRGRMSADCSWHPVGLSYLASILQVALSGVLTPPWQYPELRRTISSTSGVAGWGHQVR